MAETVASLTAVIGADISGFQDGVKKVTSGLGGIAKSALNLGGILGGLFTAGLFTAAIAEASEMQGELAQLNAVLKSTKGAAGVTADAVVGLANALQRSTRFSDDQVLSAENILLTFTKIGAKTLPAATEAVLDMSTALKMDTKSAALMVGKMLQMAEGATAAKRAGVSFTEQQLNQIKVLFASGQAAKAQAIILKELQTEFGGSAEAAGKTFAGQLDRLKNAGLDLAETVGNSLMPTLQSFLDFGLQIVDRIKNIDPGLITLAAGFALVSAAAGPIGGIISAILSPIGLLVGAVAGIKLAFDKNLGGIADFVRGLQGSIGGALEELGAVVSKAWGNLFSTGNTPLTASKPLQPFEQNLTPGKMGLTKTSMGQAAAEALGGAGGYTFGDKLAEFISAGIPKIAAAAEGVMASLWGKIKAGLQIPPNVQAAIDVFLTPLKIALDNFGQINWANLAAVGLALGVFAVGVKGLGFAVNVFKDVAILTLISEALKQISQGVDALRINDLGSAIVHFGVGVGALGIALALMNVGKLTSLGTGLSGAIAAGSAGTGLFGLAKGLTAVGVALAALGVAYESVGGLGNFLSSLNAPAKIVTQMTPAQIEAAATEKQKALGLGGGTAGGGSIGVHTGGPTPLQSRYNVLTGNTGAIPPAVEVKVPPAFTKLATMGLDMTAALNQLALNGIGADTTMKSLAEKGLMSSAQLQTLSAMGLPPSTNLLTLTAMGLVPSGALTDLLRNIAVTVHIDTGQIVNSGTGKVATRDIGGPVAPGGLYKFNVPETLQMGGQSYLMTPDAGRVIPMAQGGAGGGNTTVQINLTANASLDSIDVQLRAKGLPPLAVLAARASRA